MKISILFILLSAFTFSNENLKTYNVQLKTPAAHNLQPATQRLRQIYTAELGVREATGRNDGSRVEEYLRCVRLKRGNPWCAAFVCYCLGKADLANPRTGYSPGLFPVARVVWTRNSQPATRNPLPGDVFGIYFPEKSRIAHVGFVDEWGDKWLVTVEGNTNEAGSREGDGVYRKRRLISSVYQVARYLN